MLYHNEEELLQWIWLSILPGIGPHTQHKLIDKFTDVNEIYHASEKMLQECKGIKRQQADIILYNKELEEAKEILDNCRKSDISIVTINQNHYPDRVREITDIPVLLYYRGTCKINDYKHSVGIIGARRCSKESKQKAIDISIMKSQNGNVIISGMAKGIDSCAHTAAIKSGGYTVAVLGHGLNHCYPHEHIGLMRAIEKDGMTLSWYQPDVPPMKYNFPQRNKMIAALSDELIVIAAGKRSGTESTIKAAEKYGKLCKNNAEI
jgi:DNA processing protein